MVVGEEVYLLYGWEIYGTEKPRHYCKSTATGWDLEISQGKDLERPGTSDLLQDLVDGNIKDFVNLFEKRSLDSLQKYLKAY